MLSGLHFAARVDPAPCAGLAKVREEEPCEAVKKCAFRHAIQRRGAGAFSRQRSRNRVSG
ncbi:hypothetical protein SBA3_1210005 [Candidatus Sulfopaludibacter sp. SbA3]|nr:hypothetical protein SBA3_1210005 [Candidatus Sulfopaludibacter sp. SbA3]